MVRKLRLELDELKVETFATVQGPARGRGTVEGYIAPPPSDDTNCYEEEPRTIGLTCLEPCGSILCYPTEAPECMSVHDICPLY